MRRVLQGTSRSLHCGALRFWSTTNLLRTPQDTTSSGYGGVRRDERYSRLTPADIDELKQRVKDPSRSIVTEPDQCEAFSTDWLRLFKGHSPVVLRPTSTEEVSNLLAYCNQRHLAVVPQSGNTGMVGGSVPVFDEVVLSMQLMTDRLVVDEGAMVVDVSAGVILQRIQEAARARNLLMPLDLGAKGSCCIGGNIATNAGGLQVVRYGSMRSNTLGVEAVLADGQVINTQSKLYKDNRGLDLKQLMIGTEGTLGVVTHAQVRLYPLPKSERVAVVRVSDYSAVPLLFSSVRTDLSEILTSFEVIDAESLMSTGLNASLPFEQEELRQCKEGDFVVLMQLQGTNEDHDNEKLFDALQRFEEAAGGSANVQFEVASRPSEIQRMWAIREDTPVKLAGLGRIYKFDLSAPLSQFYDVVTFARAEVDKALGPKGQRAEVVVTGFGHFGDGNVHLNMVDRSSDRRHHELLTKVSEAVYIFTCENGNSVSAEHGIGQWKRQWMSHCKSPAELTLLRKVKDVLDPNGILNPYKLLPIVE